MKMKITSEVQRQEILRLVDAAELGTEVEIKARDMTRPQKGAMYLWFDKMAEALNDGGFDMKVVLAHHAEIPWSGASFKERVWKPALEAQLAKDSTEKQTTQDVLDVAQTLQRFFAEKFTIWVDWPRGR